MQVHIDLMFGDGTYTFKLGTKQVIALEAKCGLGVGAIYARLLLGRYTGKDNEPIGLSTEGEYYFHDCAEVIRQGLIGGGKAEVDGQSIDVTSGKAQHLVEVYVEGRPYREAWETAVAVLSARIEGYEPFPS